MELVDVKTYAGRSNLPSSTIRKWCKANILPSVKIGLKWRIDASAADEKIKDLIATRSEVSTIIYSKPKIPKAGSFRERLKAL